MYRKAHFFLKPDGAKLTSWIHLLCDCWFDLHPNTQMRINRIIFTCSSNNWSPFVLIHSQSLLHSPRETSQVPSILEIPGLKFELLSWVLKFKHTKLLGNSWWRYNSFRPCGTLKFWIEISHILRFGLLTWWP